MTKKIIRLGDPTDHGGAVTSVSGTFYKVGGIPVAFEGHKTSCGAALQSTLDTFTKG